MTIPTPQLSHPKYRPDIDGLRAVAVLSVVAFHAFPAYMGGGFIGVDVFFVISGFLISTIIFENFDRGTFSFVEFYTRRIKRIFPALLLVLIASFAFGWFALLADEYKQLGKHIAAGTIFISNFILWGEAGYFDNSAETKPLLHLWSLGIEEQFYIVWPFVLWLAWKRKLNLLTLTVLVSIISLYLNLKLVEKDAVAAFYSPLTRFWELLLGSILAWFSKNDAIASYKLKFDDSLVKLINLNAIKANDGKTLSNVISLVGSILLAYGFWFITKDVSFPGLWAVIPVLGAVLIILAGPEAWINRKVLSNKIAVWFGLISFPLYLWHYPILSFARIVEGEVPSSNILIAAVILSIFLAWLTYKLVERPIRSGAHSRGKVTILVLVMVMVITGYVGYNTYHRDGLKFRKIEQRYALTKNLGWGFWDNEECRKTFNISPCQISGQKLHLMIFGDSHGNHLFPGLVNAVKDGIGIFSGGTCPPLRDVKLHVMKNQSAHHCAASDHLSQNFNILDSNSTIDTVILSAFWRTILDGQIINIRERDYWGGHLLKSSLAIEKNLLNDELVFRGLHRTISDLMSRGKEVIFVRDTPDFENDIRDECLRRFSFSSPQNCTLPRIIFDQRRANENILIDKLQLNFPMLKVFDPFDFFCSQEVCYLVKDGMPLYRDQHHLSVYGSDLLGKAIVEKFLQDFR
jgi:peptidoglycan/LPS O-acetylase OafA/YrhL